MNAHIIGWGKYLPERIVTNEELAERVGVDAEWVRTRAGIAQRHIAAPKQASADMGWRAARAALDVADVSPSRVDLIIAATNTPDYSFPATACLIQDALGARNAGTYDLAAGCSGFLYALVTATQFIKSGAYRNIVVVGTETASRILDWRDKSTCPYFGDGAGAVVLGASEQNGGLLSFTLHADGSGGELLIMPGGGSRHPLSQETIDAGLQYGRMDGKAVFRYGVRESVRNAHKVLRDARMSIDDVDVYIPHQTNITLINQILEKLRVPMEKTMLTVSRYANISSAALPVALCDAVEAGRVQPGARILFTAYGGGLTSGAVVWRWSKEMPHKRLPFFKRLGHAVWDAQAAFRSRMSHVEHRVDAVLPGESE